MCRWLRNREPGECKALTKFLADEYKEQNYELYNVNDTNRWRGNDSDIR
jgi:hypothetical protein